MDASDGDALCTYTCRMLIRNFTVAMILMVSVCPSLWGQSTKPSSAPTQPKKVEKTPTYKGEAAPPIGTLKAPKKDKGAIRIAAFNVENLFDGVDDPTLSGEYDDIGMVTDNIRLTNIAKAIKELDADVLGLEEVESEACLRWFRDTYLKDMGYEYLASHEVGYYRGIEQAVLSRFPIETSEVYLDAKIADAASRMPSDPAVRQEQKWAKVSKTEGVGYQRSPLHAVIRLPDESALDLFVVHFKAGGKAFAYQRELESLSVVNLLDALRSTNPDAQIVVAGDFNALPNDMAAKALRDKAMGGLISGYEARPEKDRAKRGGADATDDADDSKEASKALRLKYLTHSFVADDQPGKPIQRSIDYMLVSDSLFFKAVKGSFFVLSTPKVLTSSDQRPPGYASDHCPIAMDFSMNTAKEAKESRPANTP